MPKLKTNSSAKKRYKVTAKGHVKYKTPGLRHLLHQESSNLKRPKRRPDYVSHQFEKSIRKMMPYS